MAVDNNYYIGIYLERLIEGFVEEDLRKYDELNEQKRNRHSSIKIIDDSIEKFRKVLDRVNIQGSQNKPLRLQSQIIRKGDTDYMIDPDAISLELVKANEDKISLQKEIEQITFEIGHLPIRRKKMIDEMITKINQDILKQEEKIN